jgi:hypothetical protein
MTSKRPGCDRSLSIFDVLSVYTPIKADTAMEEHAHMHWSTLSHRWGAMQLGYRPACLSPVGVVRIYGTKSRAAMHYFEGCAGIIPTSAIPTVDTVLSDCDIRV